MIPQILMVRNFTARHFKTWPAGRRTWFRTTWTTRRRMHEPLHARTVGPYECPFLARRSACQPVDFYGVHRWCSTLIWTHKRNWSSLRKGVSASVAPVIRIRNNGALTLTSLDITYSIDGVTEGTTFWSDQIVALLRTHPGGHRSCRRQPYVQLHRQQPQRCCRPKHGQRHSHDFSMNSTGSGVTVTVGGGSWDSEIGCGHSTNGTVYASGGDGTTTAGECIPNGCYTLNMTDSYGDEQWRDVHVDGRRGQRARHASFGCSPVGDGATAGSDIVQIGVTSCGLGCTDPTACNYDPVATLDDGTCDYFVCVGCTDPTACNYDPTATTDDGTCTVNDQCGV